MRRAGEALNEGGTALCRRLTLTVAVLLLLSGRAFADWGYEEIEYTMAVLNATYPGSAEKPAELGKFSEGHISSSTGLLVHVQSVNSTSDHGCTLPLKPVGGDVLPTQPWIALIRRGHCSYDQKVDNAFKSNASAVLIFNDRESPVLQKMRVSTHRDISAVFTYLWKGESLAQKLDNGTRVIMSIGVGSFCSRPYSSINRHPFFVFPPICDPRKATANCYIMLTSVLFVSISFIVLMIISLTWLVFYYVQRFRYIHAKDRLARRLCSAAKKALSKIPTKNIHSEDKEMQGEGECCAICIEPYKVSDVIRILPCRHEFHKPCIDPWLLEHRTCPMCKMDILKFYGYNFTGSQESILQIEVDEPSRVLTPEPEGVTRQPRGSVGTVTIDPQSLVCINRAEAAVNQEAAAAAAAEQQQMEQEGTTSGVENPTSSNLAVPPINQAPEPVKGESSKCSIKIEEDDQVSGNKVIHVEETLVVPFTSKAAVQAVSKKDKDPPSEP
ncbi:E3 ubiquitin-protein ligase goliath-like isoform X2 [Neocloeon triangulifer]|uniref:E3 ubiquitin-protein ligase goliath-like isoform X2 n=1 Tax=Neocloeon triangulifer TaxID=2078957 RepID=UPI00286F13EF|nr:E3 ubiquitin-protein ligase goliath-like isoform X2 [Neocloeon triangulifer]